MRELGELLVEALRLRPRPVDDQQGFGAFIDGHVAEDARIGRRIKKPDPRREPLCERFERNAIVMNDELRREQAELREARRAERVKALAYMLEDEDARLVCSGFDVRTHASDARFMASITFVASRT